MKYEDSDLYDGNFYSKRRIRKANAPVGVHIPNKRESTMLRKLMSDTGLTEKELREDKKYRKILSEAQKVPTTKRTQEQKFVDDFMKNITRELKLAKEHPKVKAEFNKRWTELVNVWPRYKYYL